MPITHQLIAGNPQNPLISDKDWNEIHNVSTPILRDDLLALKNASQMGQGFYTITDFFTYHLIPGTTEYHTGVNEPLIVFASSSSTLDAEAHSPSYPQDKIEYELVDTSGYDASSFPKGRITNRKDTTLNIECNFDFRNTITRLWDSALDAADYKSFADTGFAYRDFPVFNPAANNYKTKIIGQNPCPQMVFKGDCYRNNLNNCSLFNAESTFTDNIFLGNFGMNFWGACQGNVVYHNNQNITATVAFDNNVLFPRAWSSVTVGSVVYSIIYPLSRLTMGAGSSLIDTFWAAGDESAIIDENIRITDSTIKAKTGGTNFYIKANLDRVHIEEGSLEDSGGEIDQAQSYVSLSVGRSTMRKTKSITGLTTLALNGYAWAGIIDLTSDNATENINLITGGSLLHPTELIPSAGLVLNITGVEPASVSADGQFIFNASVDGDKGESVEIEPVVIGGFTVWRAKLIKSDLLSRFSEVVTGTTPNREVDLLYTPPWGGTPYPIFSGIKETP